MPSPAPPLAPTALPGDTPGRAQEPATHRGTDRLLLIGSIPYDTAEQVFDCFGARLGPYLPAMPDGETGPRRHWISRIHYQVFAGHPDFEILRRPAPENGVERQNPRNASDSWLFRVRPGIESVRFGDPGWRLGYARDAIQSYFVFKTLRAAGRLAPHLRFQVSLASVSSILAPRVFPEPGDVERIRPGLTEALAAEVASLLAHIPHRDLAIQWDCATEVQDASGAIPGQDPASVLERHLGQVRSLCPSIPVEVALGFHFCFGTLGGWPRFTPADLGGTVRLANAFVDAAGRRVDWIHLPALAREDSAFYAPLADLAPRGARVYLGMIHHMESFARRLAVARRILPEFGLAAYCGLGRSPAAELPGVLADHLAALGAAD